MEKYTCHKNIKMQLLIYIIIILKCEYTLLVLFNDQYTT